MKNILIISFDLIREGESKKPLAIASLLSFLKNDNRYGDEFKAEHISINMLKVQNKGKVEEFHYLLSHLDFSKIDFIALSAYIWNEYLTNNFINYLRKTFGFRGKVILGGYQISYSKNPQIEYPDCQFFINGYGEKALLDIASQENTENIFTQSKLDFSTLPSPYLNNEIPISIDQKMVRLETKRGCPYRCSFCAHRDLTFNKVHKHSLDKVFKEIAFFKKMKVKKINIIDPIFNAGKEYLDIMEEMARINFKPLISLQARFETIKGQKGQKFLDLCEKLNIHLEFGLQTSSPSESEIINRKNDPIEIKRVMSELKNRGINYEISLIYGLPKQTIDSFKQSIDFAYENGCLNLTAYPMMLLKGTELFYQKELFGFREQEIGEFNIPVVVESNTFSEEEWYLMQDIAQKLDKNTRI